MTGHWLGKNAAQEVPAAAYREARRRRAAAAERKAVAANK